MAFLYSTRVTASGGRHSSIRSEDGLLDLKLALPRTFSGRGDATNPEQLFAGGFGGFAACFENALLHVSRVAGHRFADDGIEVVGGTDLVQRSVGRSQQWSRQPRRPTRSRLIQGAHAICPYSNAIRDNVDVVISVSFR
jgi:lipoyl-dependent peroxiredoxin